MPPSRPTRVTYISDASLASSSESIPHQLGTDRSINSVGKKTCSVQVAGSQPIKKEADYQSNVTHHPHSLAAPSPIVNVSPKADKPSPLSLSHGRTLILGDSITQNGTWVSYFSYLLQKKYPLEHFDIISAGLASETTSGLSEPGHANNAFLRPCLHSRLKRAISESQPQHVIACYGMNDGIYQPLNEIRFSAFRKGMNELVKYCHHNGAQVTLATPPIYDGPIANYSNVIESYSRWLIQTPPQHTTSVCDVFFPMKAALNQRRIQQPSFKFAQDGIHPSPLGHLIIARSILATLGLSYSHSPEQQLADILADPLFPLIDEYRQKRSEAWLLHIGYQREKYIPPGSGDILATEKQLALLQSKIDRLRR